MNTTEQLIEALYTGKRLKVVNSQKTFLVERSKRGYCIPAIWLFNEDGTIVRRTKFRQNGLLMSREEVQVWVSDLLVVGTVTIEG